jgi:PIN domain nuclease of toxin-antitoxin system
MRILLDTHTLLWFIEADRQLSARARHLIEESATDVYLSIASAWEMAIKVNIGKLALRGPLEEIVAQQQRDNDITLLGITIHHVTRLTALPLHHRDPFDRLLIAQAMTENLLIVSADSVFDAYAITRIW